MKDTVSPADVTELDGNDVPTAITLPRVLEGQSAEELHRQLVAQMQSSPMLTVDGQQVDRIATPCLQVLVTAARTARSRGLPFHLLTPSAALTTAVCGLGLQHDLIS